MTEPILSTSYWRKRLAQAAKVHRHHAVFKCPLDTWRRIEERHREILSGKIGARDSVLDAGCGWGRLLDLMPREWRGWYVGVDLSPDFVALAREEKTDPRWMFTVGDLRHLMIDLACVPKFDWAVAVSIRPMVRRNLGNGEWAKMEAELRRVANRILYLEYDPDDPGSVE